MAKAKAKKAQVADPKISLCVYDPGRGDERDYFYRAKVSTFKKITTFFSNCVDGNLDDIDSALPDFLAQFPTIKARTEVSRIVKGLEWFSGDVEGNGMLFALEKASKGKAAAFGDDDCLFPAFGPTNAAAKGAALNADIEEEDDENEDY
jgi:hypothetical protein